MTKVYSTIVLGGGESGVGAALLAKKKGEGVFLSDFGSISDKYKSELIAAEIDFEENRHSFEIIKNAQLIIKSPGIPDNAPVIKFAQEQNIKIMGEVEYAALSSKSKFIAITGSNGKTTTTLWIYHILKQSGVNVGLAGNVGISLARQVAVEDPEWFVVELSSFQLDTMFDFRAHVAILTNITPDHLDRYDYKFENYINSKFRILQNQTSTDYFIYSADDPVVSKEVHNRNITAQIRTFTLSNNKNNTAYCCQEQICFNQINQPFAMFYDSLQISGKHNIYNAMAAGIAADIVKIKKEKIREAMMSFMGVEHRLEKFLSIQGVLYINDSKATNVNSTWYALESMTQPTVWIVGGTDKGNDYSELNDVVARNVKAIICLGIDNSKIIAHFGKIIDIIVETRSMTEAVYCASKLTKHGDTVLLSPACASFDLFKNYEDRGRQFKEAVREL